MRGGQCGRSVALHLMMCCAVWANNSRFYRGWFNRKGWQQVGHSITDALPASSLGVVIRGTLVLRLTRLPLAWHEPSYPGRHTKTGILECVSTF